MKIRLIIIVALLLQVASGIAQDKFEITGKMSKLSPNMKAMLTYVNPDGKNVTDSSEVKNGRFSFTGLTAYGNRAYLSFVPITKDTAKRRAQPDYQEFYLEKGKYKVSGIDSISTAKITGTQVQKDYLLFNEWTGVMLGEWKQITQRAIKAMADKDSAELTLIRQEAPILKAKIDAALDSFIFSHPDSYVTVDLVNDNKTTIIDKDFDRYYTPLSKRVMESFTGKKMTKKYEKARSIAIGNKFDFTQDDPHGKAFTLSSYKGKYVLVDFWASWCVPCRAENPNLLKAYHALKEKNFEIVSVSLDDSKASWLKAVDKDSLPWMQVSDLKGWKNDVAIQYGITAVPQNLLINGQGVIVAKNLRGGGLTEMLEKYLK